MDKLFGPYIDVLPPDFEWHPIWRAIIQEHRENIPPGPRRESDKAIRKFHQDWQAIVKTAERCPELEEVRLKQHDVERSLWAWLNGDQTCCMTEWADGLIRIQ